MNRILLERAAPLAQLQSLLAAILGRLAFGKLADEIGALPAYMMATAWMTLMVFGFVFIDSLKAICSYAVVYRFGCAGVMTDVLVTITVLTPPSRRASAMGIVSMFAWFGHAIGGYQGGVFYDFSGNYNGAYAVAAFAGVLNLIVVSSLYRKSRGPTSTLRSAATSALSARTSTRMAEVSADMASRSSWASAVCWDCIASTITPMKRFNTAKAVITMKGTNKAQDQGKASMTGRTIPIDQLSRVMI